MPREYRLYLQDILAAIEEIESYISTITIDDVLSDSMSRSAVFYHLMVIGEAVKHIPEDVRSNYPGIEWRNIGRLRDFVVHQYFGIDMEVIRDVLQNGLEELHRSVSTILAEDT